MKQVGIGQLRWHLSKWLKEVQSGESLAITEHGRPLALLIPAPQVWTLEGLVEAGKATAPQADLLDLGEPLPPQAGKPLPSEILARLRDGA